jgi:excisionase family DNA binding protein
MRRYIMQSIYTQSRSSHRRGFTGTFLRPHIRTRGAHDARTLLRLITVEQASERLGFSATTLELGAKNGLIPHYYILGHTRFEPAQLDRWIRQHHFDILNAQGDFTGWDDSEDHR